MDSLNDCVKEYTSQLGKGQIQKAYRGIMTFMSDLKSYLEREHPDCTAGALYPGYMDMTYFAFTPPSLRRRGLKIGVVFLHEACGFEVWLAGTNRQVQADYVELLRHKNIGRFVLSETGPGVDSIVASPIAERPDFSDLDELKKRVEREAMEFARDMDAMLR